ncbi:MAG: LysE family transporter [Rheinheimera sp.]|nr:LysE family transporter [Rheinheimera sp.]
MLTNESVERQSPKMLALTALGITLLNPHVYLDTVVLIGSLANADPSPIAFTIGACLASLFWFSALTAFAPKLKVFLSSPLRWRIFDAVIAAHFDRRLRCNWRLMRCCSAFFKVDQLSSLKAST